MTAGHDFDLSPLTRRVDSSAVADLRRESIAQKVQPAAFDDLFFFWMMLVTFLVLSGMLLLVDLGHISIVVKVPYTVLMAPLVAILFGLILYAIYRLRVRWTQFYRARQFAEVNAMTYSVSEPQPTWESLLSDIKVFTSKALNVFTATNEPVFEAGNYHYESWVDKKLVGTDWGYAVVDLGRPVAPMVLRSTSRRSALRWGDGAYTRNPVLALGASADRRFRLYCTAGAEDDARRLFTPELIAALRKVGRSVDVEVAGQFLFIYSARRFSFPRPVVVTAVFSVISLVSSLSRAA